MFFSGWTIATILALLATHILATPLPQGSTAAGASGDTSGQDYICGKDGYLNGATERNNLLAPAVQGTLTDWAIAILENSQGNCFSGAQTQIQSNYAYGDNKGGGATNCGPFRNNLAAVKQACTDIATQDDSTLCNLLNTNVAAAVKCQHDQMTKFGAGFAQWQRCGHLCQGDETCGTMTSYTCTQESGFYQTAVDYMVTGVGRHTAADDNYVPNYSLHAI